MLTKCEYATSNRFRGSVFIVIYDFINIHMKILIRI